MKSILTAVAFAAAFPAAAQTAPAPPPAQAEHAQHRQHPRDCHCCCCDEQGIAGRHRDGGADDAQHRGHDGRS